MRKQPKLLVVTAFLLLGFFSSHAQTMTDTLKANGYLFEDFIDGSILLHNGNSENAALNYNTNTCEIAFKQNGQYLILSNPDDVDTIYLQHSKLIPVDGKFYVVATNTTIPLLITYTNELEPVTATVDHNGTSKQADRQTSNTVSESYINRRYQGNYQIRFLPVFWLKRGHTVYKANTVKQLCRVFPQKEAIIKDYVQTNHTRFEQQAEMAQLITAIETSNP